MINSVGINNFNNANQIGASNPVAPGSSVYGISPNVLSSLPNLPVSKENIQALNPIKTQLSNKDEAKMYNEIVTAFATSDTEKASPQDNISRQRKLDVLLKSGILLNNNSNDKTSVLENIYKTLTTERAADMSGTKIAGQIIDALYNPAVITQKFGDVPQEAQAFIGDKNKALVETGQINVEASGTCVATSVEFHMANKLPAEFARWAENLTSPKVSVEKDINLSAISKNPMDAIWLLKEFGVQPLSFNFQKAKLSLKPDENAIVRAQIQDNFWDEGERTVLDVLMQSTLMQLGSEQSYNSLTDIREGKFNSNPQGLIELEKTFIESIVENSERMSLVYQNVDADKNLTGWVCSFDEIQKNITDAIDNNQDVIIGYVLTAKDCGEQADSPNEIINGHEITILDYKKDQNGNLTFICNDTDDDNPAYVEYSAEYLLPKIHHASYSVDVLAKSQNQALAM